MNKDGCCCSYMDSRLMDRWLLPAGITVSPRHPNKCDFQMLSSLAAVKQGMSEDRWMMASDSSTGEERRR